MVLYSLVAVLAWVFLGLACSAEGDWTIDSHVVIEDELLYVDRNITVVDGDTLEILGSTLVFDCDFPMQYVIRVREGGSLQISLSIRGNETRILPRDASSPTHITIEWAERVDIEYLSMSNCGYFDPGGSNLFYPSLEVRNTDDVVIRRSSFIDCFNPIELRSCSDISIEDNVFTNSSSIPVEGHTIIGALVRGNTIYDSRYGVRFASSTDIDVIGNKFVSGDLVFSFCTDVKASSNEWTTDSRWAVSIKSSTTVDLEANEFIVSSTGDGLGRGVEISRSHLVTLRDSTFTGLAYGVAILTDKSKPEAYNFVMDNEFLQCKLAILVSSPNNTMLRNRIVGAEVGISITDELTSEVSSDPRGNRILECLVEDCAVGIDITNTTDLLLGSNRYIRCGTDIRLSRSNGVVERDGTHYGWSEAAISCLTTNDLAIKCTFSGGGTTVEASGSKVIVRQSDLSSVARTADLTTASQMDLFNTSHPRLYEVDSSSSLRVYWDAEVRVRLESGRGQRPDGTLEILDSRGKLVGSRSVSIGGPAAMFEVLEMMISESSIDNRTPHEFTAIGNDRWCNVNVSVTSFTCVMLMLDDVEPELSILAPVSTVLNNSRVSFKGLASDNSSKPVEVVVFIDGTEEWRDMNGWEFERVLGDGSHKLLVTATDSQGNDRRISLSFRIDTTPPTLVIEEPPNGYLVTTESVATISGTVDGQVSIFFDGLPIECDRGHFSVEVALDRDGFYPFAISAVDDVDNDVIEVVEIVRDTVPPHLELHEIPDLTRESSIVVSGFTDRTGSHVTIDGTEVPVMPGGTFVVIVNLTEGVNRLDLKAVDIAGNEAQAHINITMDTKAELLIVAPANGTVFEVEDVELLIATEPGSDVLLDGMDRFRAGTDGFLRVPISLLVGETRLTIKATDPAGNVAEAGLTLFHEPPPPDIVEPATLPSFYLVIASVVVATLAILLISRRRRGREGFMM